MSTDLLPGMDEMLDPMARPGLDIDPNSHAAADAATSRDADVQTDARGDTFDARIHAVKPDGKPSITSRGFFRRRTGTGSGSAAPRLNLDGANDAPAPAASKPTGPEAAGATCAGLYIMIGGLILGEDFAPEDTNEFTILADAFADYCRAKGVDDFPPGLALTMACGMYAAKRLPKPRVQTRVAAMIGWVQGRWARAWAYFGSDGVRKNNAGETASGRQSGKKNPGSDTGP